MSFGTVIFYIVLWYITGVLTVLATAWIDAKFLKMYSPKGEILSYMFGIGFLGPIATIFALIYYTTTVPKIKDWLDEPIFKPKE